MPEIKLNCLAVPSDSVGNHTTAFRGIELNSDKVIASVNAEGVLQSVDRTGVDSDEQDLGLSEEALKILENEEVNGRNFLKTTSKDFENMTQNDLKEVLAKHGVDGNGIGTIRQFSPTTYPLKDDDEELLQCVRELKRRLGNMGTVLADSNEDMRFRRKHRTCRFRNQGPRGINLYHGRKVVQRGHGFRFQCESALQEWYFILFASDGISCTSKNPLNIRFSESALKEGLEEEKELHKNVKRVMEVIVGLLKDRVDVEREPDRALA
ncbi:hypothetical protein RhiirA1_528130 [Rhizophagus irregularis]|uniref:Uncharacterized protein n=1 Tax=Rhizophagus irregularis TaxID=588596 RepID=A0A2N0SL48_9GLOM|nr:hypothetical protein RhiirA1_528130 [Rhizophagus irregularis]